MTIVVLQTSPRCSLSRLGIAPMELNSRLDHRGQADVPALLPVEARTCTWCSAASNSPTLA
jgi:hypothetical protein